MKEIFLYVARIGTRTVKFIFSWLTEGLVHFIGWQIIVILLMFLLIVTGIFEWLEDTIGEIPSFIVIGVLGIVVGRRILTLWGNRDADDYKENKDDKNIMRVVKRMTRFVISGLAFYIPVIIVLALLLILLSTTSILEWLEDNIGFKGIPVTIMLVVIAVTLVWRIAVFFKKRDTSDLDSKKNKGGDISNE